MKEIVKQMMDTFPNPEGEEVSIIRLRPLGKLTRGEKASFVDG
jgi:hypothetical protein